MIEIRNLSKSFKTAEGSFEALKDVNITIEDGDVFGIIGMSGAGKSTLIRCINMLEKPTSGQVIIDGEDIGALKKKELLRKRREMSMIFQSFNLLMQRNCLDNISFPMELAGIKKKDARKRAKELLELVGLPDKADSYPAQLSGGQQQRIAIARALASNPKLLLCDEATSALDPNTTHAILELILDINKKLGITVIIITHQMSVVEEACKHVAILDGGVVVETGEVGEIFARPKSEAAKRLVFPEGVEGTLGEISGIRKLRVVYNGAEAATTPSIAQMAMEKNIMANILGASTKSIGSKAYGNMLLGVPDDDLVVKEAISYLTKIENVVVEEVD